MSNIRIWLKYDGTDFHGYQIQKNGTSIQEELEKAIEKVTGEKARLTGSSRTDAGVHASCYAANFNSETKIPNERLPLAINAYLPEAIRVYKAEPVSDDFHATFSAKEKTYEYTINTNAVSDPFTSRYSWHYHQRLDVNAMKKAARFIKGTHDFSAFCAVGAQTKTSVRTVKAISVSEKNGIIKIKITADGFLYNMVRIITGTLVYVGVGRIGADETKAVIASGDRKRAGITAPPEGLKLISVVY